MNKRLSKEMTARTTDDSSTNADEMHVSPAIAKPHVSRIPFFRVCQYNDCVHRSWVCQRSVGEKHTLLQVGFVSGFVGLQMCVLLCVGIIQTEG